MDIFALLDNKFDLKKQVDDLNTMLFSERVFYSGLYSEYSFGYIFDEILFREWKYSKGRNSIFDVMHELNLYSSNQDKPVKKIYNEIEIYSSLQLDYNIFSYGCNYKNKILKAYVLTRQSFFNEITNRFKYVFDKGGIRPIKHPTEDYYMIVPYDNKVRAVAEQSDMDTAFLLYEFTSPLIKDSVKEKRRILKLLANKYEPIIKTYLTKYNSGPLHDIFNDLSAVFNNFEIRHSNMDSAILKNYKPALEKYSKNDWIELYDTCFQLILTASMIKNHDENLSKIIEKHKQNL